MADGQEHQLAMEMAFIVLARRLSLTGHLDAAALADDLETMAEAHGGGACGQALERLAGGLDVARLAHLKSRR